MQPDILIIGAGPGGLSTALHLAQIAPHLVTRMLVLERAHHPRSKLCAGALVADAEVILQRLGLDVNEVPHVDAAAAHLDFAGRGLTVRGRADHMLRVIRRDEFDAWLARSAVSRGIEIREGVAVREVRPGPDGVNLETSAGTLRAQVVVGADGSKGVARRCVQPGELSQTARVLEILVPAPANGAHRLDHAYLDFFPVPAGIAGYTWDFPTQVNGAPKRCWGIYDANLHTQTARPRLQAPLRYELARHNIDLNEEDLQGHPIHWFSPHSRISRPRVLLVGDAAGADGLFGEGISIALGHGQLAAQAIRAAFRDGDFAFKSYRARLLRSPLGQALTLRWAITHVLYRLRARWLQLLVWRLFRPLVAAAGMRLVLNWARRTNVTMDDVQFDG